MLNQSISILALAVLASGFWPLTAQAGSDVAVLTDSVLPLSSDASVLGAADPDAPVEFEIALRLRNVQTFRARMESGGPLSRLERTRYLPSQADYDALVQWVHAQNMQVSRSSSNRLLLSVSGTAAQVEAALGVDLVRVQVADREVIAARTAPSLPQSLAKLVVGINGLQPHRAAGAVGYSRHGFRRLNGDEASKSYSVSQVKTIYAATTLSTTGAGQRTAILIDTFPHDSDLFAFWSANNIAQNIDNIEKVQTSILPLPLPVGEETLDVQWASAIAPESKVRIYATGDLEFASINYGLERIATDLAIGVSIGQLSISLGTCEKNMTGSQRNTTDQLLNVVKSYGVSILVSSGDLGSQSDCSNSSGVEFPASSPAVTAVGGTKLKEYKEQEIAIIQQDEEAWTGSGGGYSSYFSRPSWQQGAGVATNSSAKRQVPDVALSASADVGYQMILNGEAYGASGTSAGAPVWAGFVALINQSRANLAKPRLGFLNSRLYPLNATASFRDITKGNNGAQIAGPGYDRTTGLGVPNMFNLSNTLTATP